jgi:hypothetical protein
MALTLEGGCRCGACRYTLTVDAMPPVYCCHCHYCQSWSGSAFSQQAVAPVDALSATGPIVDYAYDTASGATSTHRFCSSCHSRLWNTNTRLPGYLVLRSGTLDTSDRLTPRLHIWTKRKQPWIAIADDIPTFEENAPAAEFAAILLG